MDTTTLVLVMLPILLIQIGLQIYALIDIYRNKGARPPLPTWAWVLIVVLGEMIGVIVYFIFGRKEDEAAE